MRRFLAATAVAAALSCATGAVAQDIETKSFKVVGTWNFLTNWKENELPFWQKSLPEASGGKLTANVQALNELGLKGTELMRLLKLGLFDFAHALPIYIAEDAVMEGIDIAGVAKTFDVARKTTQVYGDILNAQFEKAYGGKILNYYTWPTQMFYCNFPIKGLADLKGKKVRVQGTSQGDLVEGLGAVGVTIPFGEVVPALQRGTVDCGITGTMPAFKAGWHEVTTHVLTLPVGFTISFTGVSLATWNKLNAPTQALIQKQFKDEDDKWWKVIIDEADHGIACTTGIGTCTAGKPGKLVKVEPTDADHKALETAMQEVVLKRWAKRCGTNADCIKNWNDTIGKVVNLTAAP